MSTSFQNLASMSITDVNGMINSHLPYCIGGSPEIMKAFIQWLSHESKTSEEDENSSVANDESSTSADDESGK